LYRAADRIVVHGVALAAELVARFPVARGKVDVIPHGEYGFLAPASAPGVRLHGPPTLLFFGYLHEEKGLPDLIDALPRVARELPDLRVVIAGKPELDVGPLFDRAHALGVDRFIEWRPRWLEDAEVAELFGAATAVVLPYRQASQSGVAFLAGAWGVPLVATSVGALPEVIEDGKSGRLVPPRDPAALAEALREVLGDRTRARRFGEEHRRRCRALGEWGSIAAKTEACYRRVANPRTSAPAAPTRSRGRSSIPFVSVVMPVRDEEKAIGACLESLLAQQDPGGGFEIVVMDGRSTDATRARVRAIARRDRRVRLFDNPGRIVSTALNLGFARARGSIVVRADGHSLYERDYLRSCVRALAESGADVVGGPMVAGWCESPFERAVARALASRFGMGGAAFHFDGASGPAESVYLGCYRSDALARFGPFSESLVRDEDDEWFARARRKGGRIHLDARIRSTYRPRAAPTRLLRQYFEYGLFKPAALKSVPGSWRARQLAPSAFVVALAGACFGGAWLAVAATSALAYASALLFVSARVAPREPKEPRVASVLRQALVFAAMHFGYGLGFLCGLPRRAPDETRAGMSSVYAGYAASGRARRRWSGADPGQAALLAERDAALARRIRERFGARASKLRVLDLGSGERDLGALLREQGVAVRRVVAADLLVERLAAEPDGSERRKAPRRVAADGRFLPFRDGAFDVVVQCTMLSSLRAEAGRRVVAAEMARVCRSDGLLLSYDARLPNPLNRHVRRLARAEHRALFEGATVELEALTPLPPLFRGLARISARLAALVGRVPALRAFDLAAITPKPRKPAKRARRTKHPKERAAP
jgi:SAM-dependent methyltransferase/GT2 family glycosyltransferase